ncbi:Mannosyltransferase OCH1 (plasmid) [Marinovum algicola DG 898]|nr:Mannosyltransferase OCH1 [Marinovum algicola DG 898]
MTPPEMTETLKRAEARFRAGARAEAVALVQAAVTRQAPERIVLFARQADALLTRHGERRAALACVSAACRAAPGLPDLDLLRVAGLLRLGRTPEAAAALSGLFAPSDKAAPAAYWRYLAQVSLARGEMARASDILARARALGHDDAVLRGLGIRALMAEDPPEALAQARQAQAAFPDHAGLTLQLIRAERAALGPAAARALAEQALERFPEGVTFHLELADILRSLGAPLAARERLELAARCDPRSPLPAVQMALLHLAEGDPRAALAAAEQAETLGRDLPRVELTLATCLEAAGQPEAALARREALFDRGQAGPSGIRDLIKAHLARGDLAAVSRYLAAGQEMFPGHPVLIEQMLRNSGLTEEDFPAGQLTDWLAGCLPAPRLRRLRAEMRLTALDPAGALALLRQAPPAERDIQHAVLVAKALYLGNRIALAMRYLRLALRRWPGDPRLAGLVVASFAKAGQDRAGLALLQEAAGQTAEGPASALARHMVKLQANLGELEAGRAAFRRALEQEPEKLRAEAHVLLRELAARGQGAAAAEVLEEGRAAGVWSDPHFQKTLLGQNMAELRIALFDPDSGPLRPLAPGDTAGHVALVQDEPSSNIAAMRFLQHWQAHLQLAPEAGAAGPVVPRRIVQYWNSPEPPEPIAAMIDSWRAAPGWEHQLFDRRAAQLYLQEHCGPDWARAFRLANNPAEESDFLRLCLLARGGGVYADADDVLTGELETVVDRGAGFVAVLEPGLSTIGNNFLAAASGHPLLVLAAEMACEALLARANETTWSKTGPAMLGRAAALYLARHAETGAAGDIALLRYDDILGRIAMHNRVRHKQGSGDWRHSRRPRNERVFASALQESLDRHAAAASAA